MNNIDIKIGFKKFKHALRNIGSDADKDWKILLVLFILAFFVTIIMHLNIFIFTKNISDASGFGEGEAPQVVNEDVLNQMVDKYDDRAREFQKIASSTIVLIDPAR